MYTAHVIGLIDIWKGKIKPANPILLGIVQ